MFKVQERHFFFTMDVELQFLSCTKCIFLVSSSLWNKRENGIAHKGRLSLLFPCSFTMLAPEEKRTIAKALKKTVCQTMRRIRHCYEGAKVGLMLW
jgi:hypothetical protein